MRTQRISIIGGGIGGLSAALALHRRGLEVTVYEQSPNLGEIGAGIGLGPNAVKAFRALGIESDVIAIGSTAEWQIMRNGQDGRIISRQPVAGTTAKFGAPPLTVHRAELLNILVRSLPDRG